MLSYLSNRHYHTMTQLLPVQLRVDQPQKIYYKTHINDGILKVLEENKKISHKNMGLIKKGIQKKKAINISAQSLNACPICYQTHIAVKYHGHKHICAKCRNFVRNENGHQIKIYLDKEGKIVCLGIIPKSFDREKPVFYVTDHTKLQFSNMGVYATFAGENQFVLILKDNKQYDAK